MTLEFATFVLGPIENNTYLAWDAETREAVVIDPSFEIEEVIDAIEEKGLDLEGIWLTHAHFDHIAGTQTLRNVFGEEVEVALHASDLPVWKKGGLASYFGIQFHAGEDPCRLIEDGQTLFIGNEAVEVKHTPGHSPGHVVFYSPSAGIAFCGDLIFHGSIGRTDLPQGSYETILQSIRRHILTLPAETMLLSGHGPATTVREELASNPFLT